jgi:hypothetical protein
MGTSFPIDGLHRNIDVNAMPEILQTRQMKRLNTGTEHLLTTTLTPSAGAGPVAKHMFVPECGGVREPTAGLSVLFIGVSPLEKDRLPIIAREDGELSRLAANSDIFTLAPFLSAYAAFSAAAKRSIISYWDRYRSNGRKAEVSIV